MGQRFGLVFFYRKYGKIQVLSNFSILHAFNKCQFKYFTTLFRQLFNFIVDLLHQFKAYHLIQHQFMTPVIFKVSQFFMNCILHLFMTKRI